MNTWSWPINTSKRLSPLGFYKKLHRRFGPQGWWPTSPGGSPEPVYTPGKSFSSLTKKERFEICLGAILTQNTSWTNVVKVLALLQRDGRLDFHKLRRLRLPVMQRYFRSSGYFRQKSLRVRNFLKVLEREAGGDLETYFAGELNTVREKLLTLNGVGPETADSMLLYAAGRPLFVVDAYTRRVGQRWGLLNGRESYDEVAVKFRRGLPVSPQVFGEYHALIVKLAKDICRVKPICFSCPLNSVCRHGRRVCKKA